jgi:alpha-beta hydrolase superfamily lysophospholipase
MPLNEKMITNCQGLLLYSQEWLPDHDMKGVILLVHGLGEHCGRYQIISEQLARAGFGILRFDLQGHGKSQGKRGHMNSYDAILDDIQVIAEDASTRFHHIPLFIYGHSLGGALVLYYVLSRKPVMAGAIITSPALSSKDPVPPAKLALAKVMSRVYPSFSLTNGLDLEGLSRDPDVVWQYKNDPLVHPWITARSGMELMDKGIWISHQTSSPIPMLIMQGSKDRIVNPELVRKFAMNLKGDVEYKEWEGFYHELHNEPEKNEVIQTMLNWLNFHISPSEPAK